MPTVIRATIAVLAIIALLVAHVGCAHHPPTTPDRPLPLSEPVRAELGTIGVASTRLSPEARIQLYSSGTSTGSGEGAGEGAIAGTAVGSGGAMALLPFAMYFPPLLIAVGGIFLVSALGGAIVGAVQDQKPAEQGTTLEKAELAFKTAVTDPTIQTQMRHNVHQAGRPFLSQNLVLLDGLNPSPSEDEIDYQVLAHSGLQSLLLVQVDSVTLSAEEGDNPSLALDMNVRSTLIRTRDGWQLDQRSFTCRGGKRTFYEWTRRSDQPFDHGLSNCYEKIADRIVEELFLVTVPPDHKGWQFGGRDFAKVTMDSLQPTFRWNPVSGATHEEEDKAPFLDNMRDVVYDFKIWRADNNDLPADLVYMRQGLLGTSHRVEEPLEPSTKYFWTVRARFNMNDSSRATPWAVAQEREGYSPGRLDRVTNSFYYRFQTPQQPDHQGILARGMNGFGDAGRAAEGTQK